MKLILAALLLLSAQSYGQHLTIMQTKEGTVTCHMMIKPDLVRLVVSSEGGWVTKKEIKEEDYVRLAEIVRDAVVKRTGELSLLEEFSAEDNLHIDIFADSTWTRQGWAGRISELTPLINELERLIGKAELQRFLEFANTDRDRTPHH